MQRVLIIGLGLIGGSLAKAFSALDDYYVIGFDINTAVSAKALNEGAIDEIGGAEALGSADLTVLSIYPEEAVEFIKAHGEVIPHTAVIIDTAGIKRYICEQMKQLAAEFGFTFIGAHPMAGKEKGGYENSEAALFKGASFILTPQEQDTAKAEELAALAIRLGFGRTVITTPKEHDRIIAFTSQLPHVLASAYVQSPQCMLHKGFSAGSYRDVSRVARLNEYLWAELFMQNRDSLSYELALLIKNLAELNYAINAGDKDGLIELLKRGREIKEALGE
ncbi:MAG: prephenate dehydrogenase [Oscillospiraceae bacterium]|jgi:prephenate dehydrogenase|nr:prephenate dehydrogenase [Oscillospiraceae bacterium]